MQKIIGLYTIPRSSSKVLLASVLFYCGSLNTMLVGCFGMQNLRHLMSLLEIKEGLKFPKECPKAEVLLDPPGQCKHLKELSGLTISKEISLSRKAAYLRI